MKIIFDLRNTGLGNNGGSSTLVKSGNTLVDLGHEVYFLDSGKNQHTWSKLKAKHVINKFPEADFIIATGFRSVDGTVKAPQHCGIKCHYIRGWENWVYSEKEIINKIMQYPTIKFVNGISLYNKLSQLNINSHIVRPGYDLEDFQQISKPIKDFVVLGGLFHKKHYFIKRVQWLFDVFHYLKKKKVNVKLYLMGTDKLLKSNLGVDKYISHPSIQEKNIFYNSIDIWLSTSMQEGLHLPPAEAMMTGCPVVGTNAPLSGTIDYLFHMKNGVVSENNFDDFAKNVYNLVLDKKLRYNLAKNARESIVQIGSRYENMSKFIKLLEKIKDENI